MNFFSDLWNIYKESIKDSKGNTSSLRIRIYMWDVYAMLFGSVLIYKEIEPMIIVAAMSSLLSIGGVQKYFQKKQEDKS